MSVYLLGSRHLRVGLDSSSRVKEVHYPHLGSNNHTPGRLVHRIGVYVDGRISWIDSDDGWRIDRQTIKQALIPHTVAVNRSMGVTIEFIDAVDDENDSLLRNIHVVNMYPESREVKLFMHQGFVFNGDEYSIGTGSYVHDSQAVVHYGGGVAFAAHMSDMDGAGFDQHTVGLFGDQSFLGTYMDAEDGRLERCDHENGKVDSTLGLTLKLPSMGSSRVRYILSAAARVEHALKRLDKLRASNVDVRIHSIATDWRTWLKPALKVIDRIEEPLQASFLNNLMYIRSHIDTTGAVMTSRVRGETLYSSPRLAGYVLWPLIRLGYKREVEQYFGFMKKTLLGGRSNVSMLYSALGSEGPSLPIFTDSSGEWVEVLSNEDAAMLVFMLAQHYNTHPSKTLLDEYYQGLVAPLLDKLSNNLDRNSGLPLPSYGLLRDNSVNQATFTSSIVYAALVAGAELAEVKKDAANAVGWRAAADEVYRGIWSEMILHDRTDIKSEVFEGPSSGKESSVDYAMAGYGLFMFGILTSTDTCITNAYQRFSDDINFGVDGRYAVEIKSGGLFVGEGGDFAVAALWLAQYQVESGQDQEALRVLRWMRDVYLEPGATSVSEERRSVSSGANLWMRAEFTSTILDLITEPSESL